MSKALLITKTCENRKTKKKKSMMAAATEAVAESWNLVKQIPNYEIVGGEILFRK
jgi:hypothetical protein